MRRGLAWGLLLALVLVGFYGAWPAWTASRIRHAIEGSDPAALEGMIDFTRVRERARLLAAAEVERSLERLKNDAGPIGAAIADQLKQGLGGRLVDAAIDSILTPSNVITMVRQGKDLGRIFRELGAPKAERRADQPASPGSESPAGPAPAVPSQTPPAAEPRRLSLGNIRSYRLTGPLTLEVGVSRDPAAVTADLTAELAFTGFDWKVVGLVPQL